MVNPEGGGNTIFTEGEKERLHSPGIDERTMEAGQWSRVTNFAGSIR